MATLVMKEIRWNLVRVIVKRLEEATDGFAFGNVFVPLSSEEAAGLARDPEVMAGIADVLTCKYSGGKVDLKLGLQLSFRRRAEDTCGPVKRQAVGERRPLPVVLVIDSVAVWPFRYQNALKGRACILSALSLETGEGTFYQYSADISAVVISACGGSRNNPGVLTLVRRMRASFSGRIIATGGSMKYYQELADAGCNHHLLKRSVPAFLENILDL